MDIHVVDHPLASSRLTLMRDKHSDNAAFRAALADLGGMLVYEASRNLPVEHFECKTPVAVADGTRLLDPPIIVPIIRSEEHTSELQSRFDLVCRLLLEKKKKNTTHKRSAHLIISICI